MRRSADRRYDRQRAARHFGVPTALEVGSARASRAANDALVVGFA